MIKLENKEDLTADILRQLVHYDPETGVMTWKERDISWFNKDGYCGPLRNCNSWNAKNAGKKIGTVCPNRYGYLMYSTRIFSERYLVSRLIWLYMTGQHPANEVDHINRDCLDNRWVNLRDVHGSINGRNRSKRRTSNVKKVGVYWVKSKHKWTALINYKGEQIYLGDYKCFLDAVGERIKAEKKYGYHEGHGQDRPY